MHSYEPIKIMTEMEEVKLMTPKKGISWVDLILSVKTNEPGWEEDPSKDYGRPFPIHKETSVRPAISGRVKLICPSHLYSANKEIYNGLNPNYILLKGSVVLMVRRIK